MTRWLSLLCRASCAFAAASCSLVGDPDYRVVEASPELHMDDAGATDAGATAALTCQPRDATCAANKDCCGYAEDESLCVVTAAGTGAKSRCLDLCGTGRPCPEDYACSLLQSGLSVCVAP